MIRRARGTAASVSGERGFALVLALAATVVLSATTVVVIDYTSSNSRTSYYSRSNQTAYSLAESGINDALSILGTALNPATPTALYGPTGSSPKPGPKTTTTSEGSYTYSGVFTTATETWTITSTGSVRNPTGSSTPVTRTVVRSTTIQGINAGSTVSAWSRIYSDDATQCLTIPAGVNIPSSVGAHGNLCMTGSYISGATTKVAVGGTVTMTPSAAVQNTVQPAKAGSGWTSSGNILVDDNARASASVGFGANSPNLDANFGLGIPGDATVTGIVVKVARLASVTSTFKDQTAQLLKAGAAVGTNKAGSTFWAAGTIDTIITYGTSTDLWGTTWTPAELNNAAFGFRFAAHNYAASGTATASADYVELTAYYTLPTGIGSSGTPIATADIFGTCKYSAQVAHTPCTSTDHVYASAITTTPTDLIKPGVDFAYWYQNAAPGPKHGCDVSTGIPPVFDSNTVYDGTTPDQWPAIDGGGQNSDNPVGTSGGTTPNVSYTCQAKDGTGAVIGELSWNNVTRVLTIKGTIFFDGGAIFHNHNGFVVHYQGRATIYASGGTHNDEAICAGGSGLTTCRNASTISSWDPTQNMLVLVVGDKNIAGTDDCNFHTDYSAFQGVLWAKNRCKVGDTAYSSGPIIADFVDINGTSGAPSFFTYPPLGSLLPGQVYGSSSTSPDFLVTPGQQTG